MLNMYGLKNCDTVKKARAWLQAQGTECEFRDLKQPGVAAEHFFCLLKGLVYMRVMMGLCEAPGKSARSKHVKEVVGLFMRAYRPADDGRR